VSERKIWKEGKIKQLFLKMENHGIDKLSEAVKQMNLNSGLQNDQNILTFEEVQARLADIEKRASEVHQRVIDDHNALLEFQNKNMRTSAGKKQSEYVQNSVVVQSVEMGASAVATGSSVRDFDKGIEQPLLAESNLEVGDHHDIVTDVLPKPEVGSAGNPERNVCDNDTVTSGDDMFLEKIVSPCSLDNVSAEDDEGEEWVIFYSCEEEYNQVLEDTGSACNCLEESMLSEDIDVCSRARNFEARVRPTDLSLSCTQVEMSSTVAVHESLGLECVDCREIIFDPGGGNAPARKSVETLLRESSCLGGNFLGVYAFGIDRREFNPVRKIFDPGGRELFSTWCYV